MTSSRGLLPPSGRPPSGPWASGTTTSDHGRRRAALGNITRDAHREGKTPVATCPTNLNALEGQGVHVHRQRLSATTRPDLMGRVHRSSLTVAHLGQQPPAVRRLQYACRHSPTAPNTSRLRLPARQHGLDRRGTRAARHHFAVVDESTDPDRRGPDAADHLRPGRTSATKCNSEFARMVSIERKGEAARTPP